MNREEGSGRADDHASAQARLTQPRRRARLKLESTRQLTAPAKCDASLIYQPTMSSLVGVNELTSSDSPTRRFLIVSRLAVDERRLVLLDAHSLRTLTTHQFASPVVWCDTSASERAALVALADSSIHRVHVSSESGGVGDSREPPPRKRTKRSMDASSRDGLSVELCVEMVRQRDEEEKSGEVHSMVSAALLDSSGVLVCDTSIEDAQAGLTTRTLTSAKSASSRNTHSDVDHAQQFSKTTACVRVSPEPLATAVFGRLWNDAKTKRHTDETPECLVGCVDGSLARLVLHRNRTTSLHSVAQTAPLQGAIVALHTVVVSVPVASEKGEARPVEALSNLAQFTALGLARRMALFIAVSQFQLLVTVVMLDDQAIEPFSRVYSLARCGAEVCDCAFAEDMVVLGSSEGTYVTKLAPIEWPARDSNTSTRLADLFPLSLSIEALPLADGVRAIVCERTSRIVTTLGASGRLKRFKVPPWPLGELSLVESEATLRSNIRASLSRIEALSGTHQRLQAREREVDTLLSEANAAVRLLHSGERVLSVSLVCERRSDVMTLPGHSLRLRATLRNSHGSVGLPGGGAWNVLFIVQRADSLMSPLTVNISLTHSIGANQSRDLVVPLCHCDVSPPLVVSVVLASSSLKGKALYIPITIDTPVFETTPPSLSIATTRPPQMRETDSGTYTDTGTVTHTGTGIHTDTDTLTRLVRLVESRLSDSNEQRSQQCRALGSRFSAHAAATLRHTDMSTVTVSESRLFDVEYRLRVRDDAVLDDDSFEEFELLCSQIDRLSSQVRRVRSSESSWQYSERAARTVIGECLSVSRRLHRFVAQIVEE